MLVRASNLLAGDHIVAHEYNFHLNGVKVLDVQGIDSAHSVHLVVQAGAYRKKMYVHEGSTVEVHRGP